MRKLLCVLAVALCGSAAMAQTVTRHTTTTLLPGVNVTVVDRDTSYYRYHRDGRNYAYRDTRDYRGCPPGLAKKHNGCLPPGQAKKLHRDDHYARDVRRGERDYDRHHRDDKHARHERYAFRD